MKYIFLLSFTLIASIAYPQSDSVDHTFTKVDVEATYAGDWRSFLVANLNARVPIQRGAKAGTYTVIVQFIVDRDGNISNITALTNPGYGMENEVVRVLQMSKKWNPAIQNGRPVSAYKKQHITFVVSEK